MKKVFSLLLAAILVFAFAACDNEKIGTSVSGANNNSTATEDSADTENPGNGDQASTSTTPTLPFNDYFYGGNALALTDKNANGLTADRILNRSSYEIFHAYIFDRLDTIETKDWKYKHNGKTNIFNKYAVPEDVVYQYAAEFFDIDAETEKLLKASDRYDKKKGTFWIYDYIWDNGYDATILGYETLNNDEYVLYAEAIETNHMGAPHSECGTTEDCVISRPCFKAKIKATGNTDYIVLSFEYIDSIPDNITNN